jgi:hypothetical protein
MKNNIGKSTRSLRLEDFGIDEGNKRRQTSKNAGEKSRS